MLFAIYIIWKLLLVFHPLLLTFLEVHGLILLMFVSMMKNSRILSKERFVFWLGMVEILVFGMMFSLETLVWQYNFLALQSLCGSKVICGKYGYGISDGRGLLEVERWGVLRIFSTSAVLCGSTLWSCW